MTEALYEAALYFDFTRVERFCTETLDNMEEETPA